MRMTVLGTGYLGATHAACMAELGHDVLGIDVDESKIAKLRAGEVPFYEPGLEALLKKNLATGRLMFTDSYQDAADFADVHFLSVGTPQKRGEYAADLRFVDDVITELAPKIARDSTIIGKSTVPVGTAERLGVRARQLSRAGIDVEVAWNPEFLREGHAVEDTLRPDRIVLGIDRTSEGTAESIAREIYSAALESGTPFVRTNLATAELVKASANAFLATKISFINAIAEVCEAAGGDVTELADAIGHDERIGRKFLNAGIGFGGGCLPKDIRAFMARAGELGADQALTFLREVDNVNMRRRTRMVEMARQTCGSFLGARVAILGAAFKPHSDDVRDSPALSVAGQIQLQGAAVSVFDPQAMENARMHFPTLDYRSSIDDACEGADVVLVLTEWPDFVNMDPVRLATIVRTPKIIDGRNCLNRTAWRDAGWNYLGIGRG
ncbi:UDP-glucose/GDP-mannose dehydrogenase family protein [Williamsia muralis]|uniref:UDP-glucose dehydrogenase family protein n=1 Tax=Williamsia marianensis TaxID=85044 RepID=UPI003F141751